MREMAPEAGVDGRAADVGRPLRGVMEARRGQAVRLPRAGDQPGSGMPPPRRSRWRCMPEACSRRSPRRCSKA